MLAARAVVFVLCLLLAACVAVPQQELTSYREAYLEAQKAGDLLYDELAAAVERSGKLPTKSNCVRGNGIPGCFDPLVARDAGALYDLPANRPRRLALKAVETYNIAIVDLLEGKRGDALAGKISELRGLAQDILALTGTATGVLPGLVAGQSAALLGALVKQLDKAAAQQQARTALIENAALVGRIIDLLIADTPDMYSLYLTSQGSYARSLLNADGSYSKAAADAGAKIGAYHGQLTAYVKLLYQTKSSFAHLVDTLKNGTATIADTRATIREAIEIRKSAEAFWLEVRKAR